VTSVKLCMTTVLSYANIPFSLTFDCPFSGALQTQKLRSPLKPGVVCNITMHVSPTGSNFFLSNFYLPGPFHFLLVLGVAELCVILQTA